MSSVNIPPFSHSEDLEEAEKKCEDAKKELESTLAELNDI